MRKFKIINPYAGVDWDSWHHYKTNLHTHSTASDAQVDFSDMIKAYYDADFDILAMTDHGVVNHGWNQKPRRIPVLSVSSIIKKPTWLSDEEYGAILDGTYKNRGRGMTDLRYGIEINTAVFTKAHVNGFFTEYGQGLVGHENDFEGPVKGVAESGGLSVINHPGDWLESYVDVNHAHEKKNVELFADILKKYPSCLGIEAFNRIDTVTCADRILWDELLSAVIPSGRNVWGFANSDAHVLSDIDTSFMDFVLPDSTEQTVRRGMENGTFFSVGRRAVYELGKDFVGEGEYPTVTRITVNEDEQSISIEGKNYNRVQWISNGKIIAEGEKIDLIAASQNIQEHGTDQRTEVRDCNQHRPLDGGEHEEENREQAWHGVCRADYAARRFRGVFDGSFQLWRYGGHFDRKCHFQFRQLRFQRDWRRNFQRMEQRCRGKESGTEGLRAVRHGGRSHGSHVSGSKGGAQEHRDGLRHGRKRCAQRGRSV